MAIRHVVMWRIGVDDKDLREQTITRFAERLDGLVGVVPGLHSMNVGYNSVPLDGNWDMVLIADLEDEEALGAYAVHPDHIVIANDIRAIATSRAAVDFRI